MKKKLLCLLMALGLLAALAACSNGDSEGGENTGSGAPESSAPVQTGSTENETGSDSYVFETTDGVTVAVNADMAALLEELGEPQSYFEAESCAFEGLDKTYTYPGFTIVTRPEGEQDFVESIQLTDDSVSTPEGVFLGQNADEVTAVYGESAGASDTLLTYTKGDTELSFILENGVVVSIEYLPL